MQQRSRVWSRTVASWRLGRLLVVTAAAALIVSGAEASSEPSPGRVIAFLRESGARPASTETARSVAVMEVAVETGVDRMVRRIHLTKHSWSPNGRRLAFIDSSSLFVLDLDSGRSRRVFRQAKPWPRMSSAATLGWSPDGRRLVVAGSLRGKRGLVLVDAVGKTPARLLVAAPAPRPIVGWSPDGREIAYGFTIRRPNPDQEDGRVGMAVVDTARARPPRPIVTAEVIMEASWSPDSVKLAYVRIDGKYTCCEVHVVDRLGFNDSYVAGNQLGQGLDPVWSPDGRLAYMSLGQGGTGLHIVSIGGIDLAVATAFGNPVWSPNGRLLCSRTGVHEQRTQTIEIASADGKGVRAILTGTTALAQTSDPVWSPDSRSIAFIGADDVGTHLYLSDADGTDARQLTSGPVSDTWPNWPGLDKVGL